VADFLLRVQGPGARAGGGQPQEEPCGSAAYAGPPLRPSGALDAHFRKQYNKKAIAFEPP
jgi:hypothetical protein